MGRRERRKMDRLPDTPMSVQRVMLEAYESFLEAPPALVIATLWLFGASILIVALKAAFFLIYAVLAVIGVVRHG
jgi:hypothetical protein